MRWTRARSRARRWTCSRPSRSPTTRSSTAIRTSSSRRTSAPRRPRRRIAPGVQTAEQVVAALTGGVVSTAVNIPAISPEDMDVLGPFIPLVDRLGRLAIDARRGLGRRPRRGRVLRPDRRARHAAADARRPAGRAAPATARRTSTSSTPPRLAEERGIAVSERKETVARDFTDLVRITIVSGGERYRVAGTTLGRQRPPAPARGLGPALQPPARRRRAPRAVPLLRPAGDDGPRRHRAGRARREHLLGRGRAPAARRGRPPQRGRGHGRHHRLARCRATWSRRSRRPTASSPAARSVSDAQALLRLRHGRRVAALHHLPQAGAAQLGLEVPVGRIRGDALLSGPGGRRPPRSGYMRATS